MLIIPKQDSLFTNRLFLFQRVVPDVPSAVVSLRGRVTIITSLGWRVLLHCADCRGCLLLKMSNHTIVVCDCTSVGHELIYISLSWFSQNRQVAYYDLTTQMRQKIELFFPIQKFNTFSTRKFYMRHEKGHF